MTGLSRTGEPYDTAEPEIIDQPDWDEDEPYLEPESGRWRWVAAVAGAVLLTSVVGTIVIVTGRDSSSKAIIVPSSSRPVTTTLATPPPTSLPPETVTTLTPSEAPTSEAAPPPETPAPPPTPSARTVVYTVSGTKQPFDPVTVTYTDATGALRTEFDVALPWTKTIVLTGNPPINSVTAVSFASHLNCAITDGSGATLVSQ
ncbi:MAG TPA: hypothetical protein VMU34_26025, partial [Mycobacterium sp.]|nr:hypothetical protein [Mycobacterium sp.]